MCVCVCVGVGGWVHGDILRCIQKFPDWPPEPRIANDTALCHYVQLYRYFVSQSSEFCHHNPLCCFSASVYCCLFRYDPVRKLLDTPPYVNCTFSLTNGNALTEVDVDIRKKTVRRAVS
jgi:hypothetical protein